MLRDWKALPLVAPSAEPRRPAARTGIYRIAFRHNGMLRFGGKSLTAAIVLGLLAATSLAFGIGELPRQQRNASVWVAHTLEVLSAMATLDADLTTITSEGRGFVLDKSAESKARFDAAVLRVDNDISTVRGLHLRQPKAATGS